MLETFLHVSLLDLWESIQPMVRCRCYLQETLLPTVTWRMALLLSHPWPMSLIYDLSLKFIRRKMLKQQVRSLMQSTRRFSWASILHADRSARWLKYYLKCERITLFRATVRYRFEKSFRKLERCSFAKAWPNLYRAHISAVSNISSRGSTCRFFETAVNREIMWRCVFLKRLSEQCVPPTLVLSFRYINLSGLQCSFHLPGRTPLKRKCCPLTKKAY